MIHHIKRKKGKTHITMEIDAKKLVDKIKYCFMIKSFNIIDIKGMTIVSGEEWEMFVLLALFHTVV